MNQFVPDLIIEATSMCDRACAGCYAPNFVSSKSPLDVYKSKPDLFLGLEEMESAFSSFPEKSIPLLSIRGGEPSLHPELPTILKSCSRFATQVVLETHGRWLKAENSHAGLIEAILTTKTIIKISFDRMHGLSSEQLGSITRYLDERGISYLVAITEPNEGEFSKTRSLCSWIGDGKVIFQKQAFFPNQLLQPSFGVLGVDGRIRNQLATRFTTQNEQRGLAI